MQRQNGFTLLEVVVAFAIAAAVLTMLGQVFASGARNTRDADTYNRAIQVAESLLDELSVLRGGYPERGRVGEFEWSVASAPFGDAEAATGPDDDAPALVLTDVAVTVTWNTGNRNPRITLNRLVLASSD